MPMATTDSPRATITTSPCRSTKWAGATRNPPIPVTRGVTHSRANAAAHSRYPAVPPATTAARTSRAEARLKGARRTRARTVPASLVRENSPVWMLTTSR
jgi:hypothetical protein